MSHAKIFLMLTKPRYQWIVTSLSTESYDHPSRILNQLALEIERAFPVSSTWLKMLSQPQRSLYTLFVDTGPGGSSEAAEKITEIKIFASAWLDKNAKEPTAAQIKRAVDIALARQRRY